MLRPAALLRDAAQRQRVARGGDQLVAALLWLAGGGWGGVGGGLVGRGAGQGVGGIVEGGGLGWRRRAGLRQRCSLHLRRDRRRFGGEGKGRRLSAWGIGGRRSWRGSDGVEGGLEATANRRLVLGQT